MKIGIVAGEMEGQRTGVGRYIESLLEGLLQEPSQHQWTLFFQGHPFAHPLWEAVGSPIRTNFGGRPALHPILWEQWFLPRRVSREPLDLLFCPAYSLPGKPKVPSIVTLHDLSFEHLGHEFGWKERLRRRWLARRAAKHASRVLTDTQTIATQVSESYSVSPDRIGVVPIAVEPGFSPESNPTDSEQLESLGINRPYFLFIGSILPRRQVDKILATFAQLRREGLIPREAQLVLAGANRLPRGSDLEGWIQKSGLSDAVLRLGYLDDALLPALYRHATLTFYPSTYEGYGLPPSSLSLAELPP